MKELFDVLTKLSLGEYFIEVIIPQIRKIPLHDGKKQLFNLSVREHLGLVLLSMFMSEINHKKYVPAVSNCNYDDGAIADVDSGIFIPVEQTYVFEGKWDNNAIFGAVDVLRIKTGKGPNYASGSILLVFSNSNGEFNSKRIENELQHSSFENIIFIGPSGKHEFSYYVYVAKKNKSIVSNIYELVIDPVNGNVSLKQQD